MSGQSASHQSLAITSSLPSSEEMYQALLDKNSHYEGVFVVGVKTTGIVCRPTCNARKPKFENIEFFAGVKQALQMGYRPCKICSPLQPYGESPQWLKPVLQRLTDEGAKITDQTLREMGLEPARVRRWFQKYHGMTFQAYARSIRINRAFGLIRHQQKVIDAAMDNGFDSLSGFHSAFKKVIGGKPSGKNLRVISVTRLLTPLGPMFAGASDAGICLLEFTDRRMLETQFKRLRQGCKAELVAAEHPLFTPLAEQLKQYFQGDRQDFDLPLDLSGTPFQQAVWQQLLTIPFGQTRSYQQQAEAIGNKAAVRAVAKANGDNRISIIVPCHRVIGKNGSLTGYGGGLWRKERLLALEQGQQNWSI